MASYLIELKEATDEDTIRRILEEHELEPVIVLRQLTQAERRANAERDAVRPQLTPQQRALAEAINRRGGDGKSIRDPVEWQREQRGDVKLPGRD